MHCKFKGFIRWDTESRQQVGKWPRKDQILELVEDVHWLSRTTRGQGHAGFNVTSMPWVPMCILAIVHRFQLKQSTFGEQYTNLIFSTLVFKYCITPLLRIQSETGKNMGKCRNKFHFWTCLEKKQSGTSTIYWCQRLSGQKSMPFNKKGTNIWH